MGERQGHLLDGAPVRGFRSVSRPSAYEHTKAPGGSGSRSSQSPGPTKAASEGQYQSSVASESDVSETSSSTAESDLSSIYSDASSGEATYAKHPWWPEFGFAFE